MSDPKDPAAVGKRILSEIKADGAATEMIHAPLSDKLVIKEPGQPVDAVDCSLLRMSDPRKLGDMAVDMTIEGAKPDRAAALRAVEADVRDEVEAQFRKAKNTCGPKLGG